MSICRSCQATILWAKTQHGRSMPLDPEPSPEGNILLDAGVAVIFGKDTVADVRLSGEPLYVSHFTTCPDAAGHRKSRKSP